MGGVSLKQPLINDDPLPLPDSIAKGDQIEGLLSAGWTNERHSSYISSMEASFVEQIYGQDNCNYDANKNNLRNITINSFPENPWVRHFKPRVASVHFTVLMGWKLLLMTMGRVLTLSKRRSGPMQG